MRSVVRLMTSSDVLGVSMTFTIMHYALKVEVEMQTVVTEVNVGHVIYLLNIFFFGLLTSSAILYHR